MFEEPANIFKNKGQKNLRNQIIFTILNIKKFVKLIYISEICTYQQPDQVEPDSKSFRPYFKISNSLEIASFENWDDSPVKI